MTFPDDALLAALLDGARQHLRAGRIMEAERDCLAVAIRDPAAPDGLVTAALVCRVRGDLAGAERMLCRALTIRPDHAEAWGNRAVLRLLRGQPGAALAEGATALSLAPALGAMHALRARLRYGRGEHGAAVAAARRALVLGQDQAELPVILVDGLRREDRLAEAEAACRAAVKRSPDRADLWVLLGLVLADQGDDAASAAASGRAVLLEPAHPAALSNRGNALLRLGRSVEALMPLRAARAADPRLPAALLAPVWQRIGEDAQAAGDWLAAMNAFVDAARAQPDAADRRGPLAIAASAVGQQARAETALRIARSLDPAATGPMTNLATVLVNEGRIAEATALLSRVLTVDPSAHKAHSNRLFADQYQPGLSPAQHRAAHRAWHDRHGAALVPAAPVFANDRDPERRLRVGIVSADLKRHPVGYFLAPFLAAHDRERLAVTCYANQPDEDALTDALRRDTAGWRRVDGVSDEALTAAIRADGIDVLIDLSGHTAGNRLPVFARRPAPVQVTWMGYVHTTGMPVIDAIVGGGLEIPAESASWFEEARVLALPQGRFCYRPPEEAPPVAPPPSSSLGRPVTFGSFNTLAKLSDPTVALWSRVLAAVPESRLVLKARPLRDPGVRDRIGARFAAAGTDPARIELRGWSSHAATLAEYGDLDVALDPRPFSGGLTSCEALWMGVPMVAWPGDTPAGRQSAHFLTLLGLSDLVVGDAEAYVAVNAALGRDRQRLAALRAGLRERMTGSPLLDGPGFARGLEDALRTEWRRWCGKGICVDALEAGQ